MRAKHASNWPPQEETLADEFISYFKLEPIVFLGALQKLCDSLGINVRVMVLPESLRGHNYRFDGKREIYISERQILRGTEEHTALHELRELLEYEFNFAVAVRVFAFGKEIPSLLEHAAGIEQKWPRRASYVLLFVVAVGYVMALTLLPHVEDIADGKRKRGPRFPKP